MSCVKLRQNAVLTTGFKRVFFGIPKSIRNLIQKNTVIFENGEEYRPYEKCLKYGAGSLTDAELLAVIIRTGTRGVSSVELARRILSLSKKEQGLLGICHLTGQELMQLDGVGKVKAIQILCIGELSKRIATCQARRGLSFTDPGTVADYYMEQLRHEEQEVMVCMMLDTKNHLIGEELISKGTVNASLVTPRELFLAALRFHAVYLILVHNHPSGDSAPSQADIDLTGRIRQAGELLGIFLLDHIIIGDCQYFSFQEKGILLN